MRFFSGEENGSPPRLMEPVFEKLLGLLAEAGVQFIVVGGVAVTLNGYVRLTEDVDILLEDSVANIQQFITAMSTYGEGFARELGVHDFTDEEGAIRIVEEVEQCQVDVFTRMSGLRLPDLRPDAGVLRLSRGDVLYASRASLIRLKERSLREKDQLDVIALKRLSQDPQ